MSKLNTLIAFLSIILVTACGGGGGGSSEPTPTPTPAPTPAPNPYTEPSIPDSVEQDENQKDVVDLSITATEGYTVAVDIDSNYEFRTGIDSGKSAEEFNEEVTSTLGNSDGTTYVLNSDYVIGADEVVDIVSTVQLADGVTVSVQEGGKLISKDGFGGIQLWGGNFECNGGSLRNLGIVSGDITQEKIFFKINQCSYIGGAIDLLFGVYEFELKDSYIEGLREITIDVDTDIDVFTREELNPNNLIMSGNIFYLNSYIELNFEDVFQNVTRELVGNTFYTKDDEPYTLILEGVFGRSTLLLKDNAFLNTSVKAFRSDSDHTITATNNYYGIATGNIDDRYDSNASNLNYGNVTVSPVFNYEYEGAAKFQPRLSYENESFILEVAADYEANQREFNYKIVLDDGTSVVEYPNVALTIINVQD